MLKWHREGDEKTLDKAVWHILKQNKMRQSGKPTETVSHQKNNNDRKLNQQNSDQEDGFLDSRATKRLAHLSQPSHGISKLVLVMIRHTTLVISYMIFACAGPVLLVALGSGADFGNAFSIIINLLIYMLFPIGDKTHTVLCYCVTQYVFWRWHDKYTFDKTSLVNEVTCKLSDKYDQLENISIENSVSVNLEIIEEQQEEMKHQNTQTNISSGQTSDDLGDSQSLESITDMKQNLKNQLTKLSSLAPNFNE